MGVKAIVGIVFVGFTVIWPLGCDRSNPAPTATHAPTDHSPPAAKETNSPSGAMPQLDQDSESPSFRSNLESISARPPQTPLSDDPTTLAKQGIRALQTGDVDSAYRYARAAMMANSEDPQIRFLMARVLGARHRFPEAIQMLDQLAESAPQTRLPSLGQTAQWMIMQGDLAAAEQRFNAILEELPGTAMVHRELANLMLRQGRRREAARHLGAVCRQGNIEETELRILLRIGFPFNGDTSETPLEWLTPEATARAEIGQGNWDDALRTLTDESSDSARSSALIARIHAHQQSFSVLADLLSDGVSNDADDVDTWFAMGTHEAASGRPQSAVRCFCEVVIRDPTDASAYDAMSQSLAILGSQDAAAEASKRAKLIRRTHALGQEMAQSVTRDLHQMSQLADMLDQLHRPIEALAWRAMRLAYEGKDLSPEQTRQQMADINQRRLEILQTDSFDAAEGFLCCGIDLQRLRIETGIASLPQEDP